MVTNRKVKILDRKHLIPQIQYVTLKSVKKTHRYLQNEQGVNK